MGSQHVDVSVRVFAFGRIMKALRIGIGLIDLLGLATPYACVVSRPYGACL